MKLKTIFIFLLSLIFVSLLYYGHLTASAQKTELPTPSVGERLAALGIYYGKPSSPPNISQAEAIQLARLHTGERAEQTTEIVAEYVLFSDDQYGTLDAEGQEHLTFQNVPAWVVTFKGINHYTSRGKLLKVDLNVVINALTGEYMIEFGFRSDGE